MEVDDRVSQQILDNGDDDDDGPMVFKRNNPPSKQSQFGSASKNILEKHETSSGRPVSVRSPNGENMYSRRNKVASTSKSVTDRFTAASTRTLTSKPSASKSQSDRLDKSLDKPSGKPAISDDSDDDKPLSFKIPGASTANRKSTYLPLNKPKEESDASDDSDDDKPLSFRVTTNSGLQKSNSLPAKKLFNSQNPSSSLTKKKNDLQDGKLTSSKSPGKSGIGSPTTKSFDSDEEKPLSAVLHKNASCKSEPGSTGKTITDSNKRHLANANNSVQSPNKKARPSDTPEYAKVKQESTLEKEMKTRDSDDDDDYVPLAQRTKKTAFSNNDLSAKKALKKVVHKSFKKEDKKRKKGFKNNNYSKPSKVPPGSGEGQKWTTLEHSGVIFPPPYKPHGVKMLYNGQPVDLTPEQEEVATMFAVMKDTDYASKKTFIDNFMSDWRTILGKNHVIKKFELCDFSPIYEWHLKEKEKKKQMTAAEKKAIKEEKLKQEEKYMWAIVDGVKEKVGNFRVEPPGLFRGRGEHPKMGKLKKRIRPRDITINIGKGVPVPECPIPGERWKEVKHDNTVTWLAFWNDPINPKEFKYVFLAASSSLKGQSDKEKYEKARKLKDYIRNIRATYTKDFTSKDEMKRQIAVATYLIDKLALRAGNEKDDDEADTVGCCTLKVENVTLVPPNKLQFDFLGKDSIRYFNTVEVELQVYKAIGEFRKGGKKGSDDLFDKLDTSKLNAHLKELMPGLTAKVFRTYNASITLDEMLNKETEDGTLPEKIAVYQRANKEVAIICNHQRSVSKSHDAQMLRLNEKIEELKAQQKELEVDLDRARRGKPPLKDAEGKTKRNLAPEAIEKKLSQTSAKIEKMELDKKIKEDLKTVALGTSKINYLDPRISVAWCKRLEVPIEKIFNKSLLAKFAWAMDVDPSFRF